MNTIDYSSSMAPILDSLFDKFSQTGNLNYCIICLRTERRLVKNRSFIKFTSSMKLDKRRWKHQQICYICERQAYNALKFLNAATFAAAIDTIFAEIIYEKRNNNADVFHSETFNNILNKFGLDKHKASPLKWDLDLEAIRKSSQLIETQPLVVDNLNTYMPKVSGVQIPAAPEELYVIPDEPPAPAPAPAPASLGAVTGLATRCHGVITEQPQKPMEPVFRKTMTNKGSVNNVDILFGSEPNISEALVILDDDEDYDPLQIRIDNVVSNAVPQPTSQPLLMDLLTRPSEPPSTVTTPSKAPLLVPLESLLEKPKEIFTGDGLLVGNPEGNYTIHPIAIKEGVTTVPSLDAKLVNGQLIYNKIPQVPLLMPINVSKLQNHIKHSKNVIMQNNIFPQIIVNNQTSAEENSKTTKRDSPSPECATPNKMSKVLPVEEHLDTDKSRIDWEDKIPMDVISYVDAVDPNRDPRMMNRTKRRGQRKQTNLHISDVINLC